MERFAYPDLRKLSVAKIQVFIYIDSAFMVLNKEGTDIVLSLPSMQRNDRQVASLEILARFAQETAILTSRFTKMSNMSPNSAYSKV